MTEDYEAIFDAERRRRISGYGDDKLLNSLTQKWVFESMKREYLYNFNWLGRPIIQYPQDIVAIQEIIWSVKPTLIIETGVAHGGSLVLSASLLALLDYFESEVRQSGRSADSRQRRVVGIDIEIRDHNRRALDGHPLNKLIKLIEGSSIDPKVVDQVSAIAHQHETVLVLLDSNHTHEHVLAELRAYTPLVTFGSYCVVLDTFVENMPAKVVEDRPWEKGNSPLSAIWAFLNENDLFEPDSTIDKKLLITAAPSGYLRRTK